MSNGTPEELHRDDVHNGSGEEKKENHRDDQNMAHGTPEDQSSDHGDPESPPSVVVNGCGDDSCSNASSSSAASMAKGLSAFITSIMEDYDSRAEATISSQNQLAFALDRLTGELDQLLDDAPLPFIMQHGARISGVRKRVKSLNLVLKSIQRRIDNVDRFLSAGPVQGNPGPNS